MAHYVSKKFGWGTLCADCGKSVWSELYYCPAPRFMAVLPRIWKCWDCYMRGRHDLTR